MMHRVFRSGLCWLLCGALAMAGCASGGAAPLAPALTPPRLTPAPQVTATTTSTLAQATLPSTQTIAPPTSTPSPARTPEPTATATPTAIPTGISLDVGYIHQNGQNPFTAVVQYKDMTGSVVTQTVHFLLYLPASYGKDLAKKWPLMIYLHGSGTRGNIISMVRQSSLPKILDETAEFPFIVISPQCPADSAMWSSQIDSLNALLDLVIAGYSVDPQRVYATGFSMGGFGTWEFALRYPGRFAAIAPVAGGYIFQSSMIPANLCDLKNLPVWVFHGDQDESVAPEQDISLVNALRACGGNVRFTYYKGAGHLETGARAYANATLYTWFAAQKKSAL